MSETSAPMRRRELLGIERIVHERGRQMTEEGWTEEHDDQHTDGSLALAAACYAAGPDRVHVRRQTNSNRGIDANVYRYDYSKPKPGQIPWPWDAKWWKPTIGDRIRDLEKAGALIAAEIDRLRRADAQSEGSAPDA